MDKRYTVIGVLDDDWGHDETYFDNGWVEHVLVTLPTYDAKDNQTPVVEYIKEAIRIAVSADDCRDAGQVVDVFEGHLISLLSRDVLRELIAEPPAMEILQCDRCGTDLEDGQIGLCGDCQEV